MGTRGDKEFKRATIMEALTRQGGFCASCGTRIWQLGKDGAMWHKFGESAEAHHARPVLAGGTADVANCVVVCRACHISAHQGGAWADISIYDTGKKAGGKRVYASPEPVAKEYPFYKFSKATEKELARINR